MSEQTTTTTATNGNGHHPTDWKEAISAAPLPPEATAAAIRAAEQAMRQALADLPLEEREPVFKPFKLKEFLKRPKKQYHVKGLIGLKDLVMIFSEPGKGKTLVALDMAYEAATGGQFAGRFDVVKPLKVAYCSNEGIDGLPNRLTAAANGHKIWGTDKERLMEENLFLFTDIPQLYNRDAERSIYKFVDDWQASQIGQLDILIIDTLHNATYGADENFAKDAGLITEAAKYAIEALGCAVVLVHHSNRAGKYRGSSAFHGDMDMMVEVQYDKKTNIGILECFKPKDAEDFGKLYFRMIKDGPSESVFLQWVEETVVQLESDAPKKDQAKRDIITLLEEKPGLSQTQIVKTLTEIGRKTILAALKDLEDAGMVDVGEGPNNSRIYQLRLVVP